MSGWRSAIDGFEERNDSRFNLYKELDIKISDFVIAYVR